MDEMAKHALQTEDSKFDPWWSEAELATSWSRRFPQYKIFASERRKHVISLKSEFQRPWRPKFFFKLRL